MFVLSLVKDEFSDACVAILADNSSQQTVRTRQDAKTKNEGKIAGKRVTKSNPGKIQVIKEVPKAKTYTEEAVIKDRSWNIYTGNPGFYTTEGDTVYFGSVTALSDSAFLEAQSTVVPKIIKPYGIVGKELIIPSQEWIFGVVLILWMIFASVRVGFPKYLSQIFASTINFNDATRLFRQRGYKTMYGAVRLDTIFHLILPLSVFQISRFFRIELPGYHPVVLFLALLLLINGYFFIKVLLYRLVGSIAMLKEQTEELIFNIKLYYKVLGLFLLPFVTVHAILAGTNFMTIWIMAGLIIVMYVSTIFRSIFLGHQKDISIFYLILYLCTLEILPLLLIFKLTVLS
jgi:hypothetical protein